jgi:hypothetical protein
MTASKLLMGATSLVVASRHWMDTISLNGEDHINHQPLRPSNITNDLHDHATA